MKFNIAYILFTKLILLFTLCASAHAQCPHFTQLIQEGDAHYKANAFRSALNSYQAAIQECSERAAEVQPKVLKVFDAIERLKTTAEQERTKTAAALVDVQHQKEISDSLGKLALQKATEAESQRQLTEIEFAKNAKLVNAFYFYQRRFALAFGTKKNYRAEYYFIDKNGEVVEKLGYWTDADQFNSSGFAKVADWFNHYLLDTFGRKLLISPDPFSKKWDGRQALDFSSHSLLRISSDDFDNFHNRNLEAILLGYNKLTTLPRGVGILPILAILDLQYNRFESLPSEIATIRSMKNLILNHNRLVDLPTWISNLAYLQNLDLADNQLKSIPSEIGQLSNLTRLDLFNNHIHALPQEIMNLQALQILNLRENPIGPFPTALFDLTNLQSLEIGMGVDLSALGELDMKYVDSRAERFMRIYNDSIKPYAKGYGNSLPFTSLEYDSVFLRIPIRKDSFFVLKKQIAHNAMTEIPIWISRLQALQRLDLSGNKLSKLPPDFSELHTLRSLSLAGNYFTDLGPEITELNSLRSLDLSHNQLKALPAKFAQLDSLARLSLSFNQFATLPPEISKLKNLEYLMLGFNPCSDTKEEQETIQAQMYSWLPRCQVVFR